MSIDNLPCRFISQHLEISVYLGLIEVTLVSSHEEEAHLAHRGSSIVVVEVGCQLI